MLLPFWFQLSGQFLWGFWFNAYCRQCKHGKRIWDEWEVLSALGSGISGDYRLSERKEKDENYKQGVELVLKQFKDVLKSKGVEEIEALGQVFDPELHEAVGSIQDDNLGEKEIAQEYRKGYKIGSKVIRHSMVIVAN